MLSSFRVAVASAGETLGYQRHRDRDRILGRGVDVIGLDDSHAAARAEHAGAGVNGHQLHRGSEGASQHSPPPVCSRADCVRHIHRPARLWHGHPCGWARQLRCSDPAVRARQCAPSMRCSCSKTLPLAPHVTRVLHQHARRPVLVPHVHAQNLLGDPMYLKLLVRFGRARGRAAPSPIPLREGHSSGSQGKEGHGEALPAQSFIELVIASCLWRKSSGAAFGRHTNVAVITHCIPTIESK